jgi:hypothetical protein
MSNELANILASNPNLVQTGLDADTLAVAGGTGGGGGSKSIRIKGGVFRKYVGSKEIGAIEDRHMNIIIVKMAHKASRMMYDGPFVEGETSSAVCWSTDSNKPDESVEVPSSVSCSTCPYSIKGSGTNGVGTKCSLFWKVAVVLPNDVSGDVMELKLPSASTFGEEKDGKRPFRPYIQHLAQHNVSAGRVITKMQFDTTATFPKVVFSPVGAVPESDLDAVAKQSQSKEAEHAVVIQVYKEAAKATEIEFIQALGTTVSEEPQAFAEPVKRESPAVSAKVEAVADVVKKWSKT